MNLGQVLTELATGVSNMFVSIFEAIAGIFVELVPATESAAAYISVTPIGWLALIGLVIGIVTLILNKVTNLFKGKK